MVSNSRYKDIIKYLPHGYAYHRIVLDDNIPIDYIFLDVNPAFEELTGLSRKKIIGKRVTEVIPGFGGSGFHWVAAYGKVAMTGENIRLKQYSKDLKRWYDVTAYSNEKGYFTTIFNDVTVEKETELKLREKEKELKEAQSMAKLGRWDLYHRENKLEWTDNIYEIFERNPNSFHVTYENFLRTIHPEDRDLVNRAWQESLVMKKPYVVEHRIITKDGRIKWLKEQCRTEFDEEGRPIHSIGIVQDITEIKKTQEQLTLKQRELNTFFNSSLDLLCIVNGEGEFIHLNPEWENSLGYSMQELEGKSILEYIHPEDIKVTLNGIKQDKGQGSPKSFVNRYRSKAGQYKWLEWRLRSVEGLLYISARDITRQKKIEIEKAQKQKEIEYLSFYDYLTNLYNRRFFEEELKRLDTARNLPLTIIKGDVDGLKLLNDCFGHHVGDELLIKVSEILRKACRTDDIIARIGGDEYAILLPKTNGHEAEKIIKRIKNLCKNEEINGVQMSISLGYGTKLRTSDKIKNIQKKAEDLMYHNKLIKSPKTREKAMDNIIKLIESKLPEEEDQDYAKRIYRIYKRMLERL